jgi:glycosyltransferase involved in cell wall biosynthesis
MKLLAPDWRVNSTLLEDFAITWSAQLPTTQPTLWFEIDDLVRHFDQHCHPMGIQRVSIELLSAAMAIHPARTRLVRLCRTTNRFLPVAFDDFKREIARAEATAHRWTWVPARIAGMLQAIRYGVRSTRRFGEDLLRGTGAAPTSDMQPGDVLVSLGASWNWRKFPAIAGAELRARGMKLAFLLHDIIPLCWPRFAHHPSHVADFRVWLEAMLSNSDLVLTSSRYSRDELLSYCQDSGLAVPRTAVVPFGGGFRLAATGNRHASALPSEPYVLCVSTIEIRKNHALLVEVWRRLIERHGRDRVPQLVFIGEVGWGVKALMRELRATDGLGGKIIIRSRIADAALHEAYRGALFTIYPSLCEGWGLPISESLAQGTACLSSDATSLPEVGGDFVSYFDPLDVDGAFDRIEQMLFDEDEREAAAAWIRASYRRRSWEECLQELVSHIDKL